MLAELYHRAEARLRGQPKGQRSNARNPQAAADAVRLLHELEVHQIELEIQNAELQKARDELETTLAKYTDLYHFAPVGYFSIDEAGVILEASDGRHLARRGTLQLISPSPLFASPTSRPIFRPS
jgi:hypothetical protein